MDWIIVCIFLIPFTIFQIYIFRDVIKCYNNAKNRSVNNIKRSNENIRRNRDRNFGVIK